MLNKNLILKEDIKNQVNSNLELCISSIIQIIIYLLGIKRVLWLQLFLLPYNLLLTLKWHIRWFVKFRLNKHELGDNEKIYLICRNLKINREQYESLPEKEQYQIWNHEIWIKENFKQWKQEKEAEQKIKLSESGRYKAYRRYMKSGGPGQITFDGD